MKTTFDMDPFLHQCFNYLVYGKNTRRHQGSFRKAPDQFPHFSLHNFWEAGTHLPADRERLILFCEF